MKALCLLRHRTFFPCQRIPPLNSRSLRRRQPDFGHNFRRQPRICIGFDQAVRARDEGVWKVESRIIQADQEGSILGVGQGDPWVFYVIDGGNGNPIDFHMPPVSSLDLDNPEVIFIGDLTGGDIVQGKAYVSSVFNSAVIEQTERTITESSFTYSVDLEQIPNSFPNFDPFNPDDRLVITFFVDGMTSNGSRQMAAKVVYISGVRYLPARRNSGRSILAAVTKCWKRWPTPLKRARRELRGRDTGGLVE